MRDSTAGEHLYRLLLLLYPPRFRSEIGDDLVQLYRDRRRERRHQGAAGKLRLGVLMAADLVRSVPREWMQVISATARRDGDTSVARRNERAGPSGRAGSAPQGIRARPEPRRRHTRRGTMGMGTTLQDLGLAARSFLRRPGFTLATVATLAVGIAGATTLFSVLDGVVLRPLPYPESGRLVQLGTRFSGLDRLSSISPAEAHGWGTRLETIEVAASRLQALTLLGEGDAEVLMGAGVSGSFFDIFAVRAERGRLFGPDEDRPGAPPVAVLTHGVWRRRWGSDAEVIGHTVVLDRIPFTVVGVLPRDYVPPEAIYHGDVDVYFPLQHVADDVSPSVTDAFLQAVGRRAPGVGIDAARAELEALQAELVLAFGGDPSQRGAGLAPLHERTVGDFGNTLLPFLGAVGLLLLVACANVGNLSLVRATERGREMSVRTALGAGRLRLARQLLTESLVTAVAASAVGAALAWGGVAAFRRFAPDGIPRASEVTMDPRVLLFALGLAVLTGLLFGLAPVLDVLRSPDSLALRERGAGSPRGNRLRSALVVGEVALALVLFVGAALLASSFVRLVQTDLGFEPEGMAWMTVAIEGERWETPEARVALFRALEERLAAQPGVVAVGGTNNLPLGGNRSITSITVEGFESAPDAPERVSNHRVLPGYFEAAGIDVVRGRTFTRADDGMGTVPVVVSEAMARAYWPDGRGLGGRLHLGGPDAAQDWMEVVGVVSGVRHEAPGLPPVPELYLPYAAFPSTVVTLVARTPGDPTALLSPMRAALRAEAPELPSDRAGTMAEVLGTSVVRPRFYALLLGAFAGISLLLAVMGVYGTMAYAVRQRTRELGVRMALGADRGRVRTLVLRRGLGLAATGLAIGVALSLASTRLLEEFVYDVTTTDPATLAGAALALAAAAALASWIPAVRATRIDPTVALRAD